MSNDLESTGLLEPTAAGSDSVVSGPAETTTAGNAAAL